MNRYGQLISILVKYGFHDVVEQMNLRYYLELGKSVLMQRPAEEVHAIPRAVRMRLIIEELGTTFIKFGQIMSTRPDFIPEDVIHELKKLQDEVPPFPTEEAMKIVEREFEKPAREVFKSFSDQPIASASIAQVYKAELPTGEEVAVKVQRPDIQKVVETDLEIMMDLARLAEAHIEAMQTLQPVAMVEEFSRVISNEMDFHIEARSIERFLENFKGVEQVQAPQVFRDFSTRTILTTTFIKGIKVSETAELQAAGYDTVALAKAGADAVLRQVFEHGFFHGDPHPGNLLATGPSTVCFLDFGMMGRLDVHMQEALATMLICVVRRDDALLTRTVLQLATNSDDIRSTDKLQRSISDFIERYAYLPLDKVDVGGVLQDLLHMLVGHGIKLPPEIYLLIKAMVTIEGVGHMLDPNFVFITYAQPYVEKLVRMRYDPRRIFADLNKTSAEIYRLVRDLPSEIRELLKFVRRGELKVNLETHSIEPLMRTWDRDFNRLAFAIVNAALLLSSSVIMLAKVPPLWHGVSAMGMLGVGASFLMAFWLLIAIWLSGHL